jgi:hypothetical protein
MHPWYKATIKMQVRATDGTACHLDDRIALILDDRIVDFLTTYVASTVPR